jgi:HPt (histidine-containing phosphotransfer) domain-containing protein
MAKLEPGSRAPPATAEPAREVLDHRRLDTLRELDDGQGSRLLTRLVAAFLSGAPADLAGLRAAVERGDARAMGDVAHHLKGAAATLGSSRIVELCEDIESLAGADDYLVKPVEFFNLQSRLIAARRVTALHAELASYRAELSRLAHIDPLTRLGNRLSMEEELTALNAPGRRYGHRYCLAMCDVDLFKTYNDTLGHHAGDEALQAVVARMKREVRSGDGVYRYGGRSSC